MNPRDSYVQVRSDAAPSPGAHTLSQVAIHESGHALVGRFFALPIKSATILSTEYFAGRVLAPGAHPNASPAAQIAFARGLCEQAATMMPGPGEDPADAAP
jgi:hypothetical protein